MDTELRQRVQALLNEDKSPSRDSKLRKEVKRVLSNEKRGTSRQALAGRQPPPATHSAPPLEQGQGDREVLQMAGADFDSE